MMQDATKVLDKLPNETKVGCYVVDLLQLKGSVERQMRGLHQELLNGLRRKVNFLILCALQSTSHTQLLGRQLFRLLQQINRHASKGLNKSTLCII